MNQDMEQFEQRLRRQPVKQVPGDWRAEILAQAKAAQPTHHASRIAHSSLLSTINHHLSTLLWPHPVAWAGLAAVWLLVFAINLSTHSSTVMLATATPKPAPEILVALTEQHKLYAELMGPAEPREADHREVRSTRPHSRLVVQMAV